MTTAQDFPEELQSNVPVEISDLLSVAATILALVQVGRGQLRSEAEERTADLERAVLSSAFRGRLSAWDLELIDSNAFGTPARALVWLCIRRAVDELGRDLRTARVDGRGIVVGARRAQPWDVLRFFLVTVPRSALELDDFAAWLEEAQLEVDLVERARPTRDALEQLLAERRRLHAIEQLGALLRALDEGTPPPDTAARLRALASLFGDAEPADTSRKAA